MGEKNIEKTEVAETPKGGDQPAEVKEFPTAQEAAALDRFKKDPAEQERAAVKKEGEQAVVTLNKEAGKPGEIYKHPAVQKTLGEKPKDAGVKVAGGELQFGAPDAGTLAGDIQASRRGNKGVEKAESLAVSPFKPSENLKVDDQNKIGEIDKARDNPDALKKAYGEDLKKLVDSGQLSQDDAARMNKDYAAYLDKMKENFTDKDGKVNQEALDRVYHSMNVIRDSNLISDMSKANSMIGLAARGADPKEANRQGEHNSCSPTSLSRVEQQRDFASYAERMASLASRGGAWMGSGADRRYVNINQDGTNGANLIPDQESAKAYNPATHQKGGERDYLGQLDNAAVGQLMATYAGERDGKDYTYVTANANRIPGGHVGQSATGEGYFARGQDGKLQGVYSGQPPEFQGAPPASPDIVGRTNLAMGGGGIFIQKELADKYPGAKGINSFTDAADLRRQLQERQAGGDKPGQEYQIWTNGTMVAGKSGHGHHNQTIALDDKGGLVMGNNWTDKFNHVAYTDSAINSFTTMSKWDSRPNVSPDGSPRDVDWNNEIAGPDTRNPHNKNDGPDPSDRRKEQDEKEQQEKDEKAKNKKEEEEEQQDKKKREKKTLEEQNALKELQQELSEWQSQYNAAAGKGEDALREFLSDNPKPQPKF